MRAGLHDCVIVIVSYQSERVVCKAAYWERCLLDDLCTIVYLRKTEVYPRLPGNLLHACVIVIVSYQSERVLCKVAYWERCVILLTHASVAEEIFTSRVSVILSPEGAVEISL